MRSEFEKWYRDKYQVTKQLYFFEDTQRYEDGFAQDAWEVWQHRQTEVDELQKKNAWLSGVAERENKRANKLQEEKVSTTTLLGKTIQKKNELQKRVDELQTAFKQLIEMENESISFEHDLFDKGWNQSARQTIENIYKLTGLGEQALKGAA